MALLDDIRELERNAREQLDALADAEALEQWRIRYLGSKGELKAAMQRLREVPKEDKPAVGKAVNELKGALTEAFEARKAALAAPAAKGRKAAPLEDITLPGERPYIGHTHIITQTIRQVEEIFGRMGFEPAYGPEVEDEWHNFQALNTPPEHPARDPLDNFYLAGSSAMLRSQTSTVQIRAMEVRQPPVRVCAIGRVHRPDTVDATHMFMFHQVEGLYVDEGVSMADLRTCVDQFCKAYFGHDVQTRFRPHFFPFTEPSAEVDLSCHVCGAAEENCPVCRGEGWIELGGCGMVDPNVLEAVGYDSERYTGYAFGLGIDRGVMKKYGIPDIRLLFENDVRFLRQF
jgi:phenylalanyl-tRNA synthetase alpha chain